LILGLETVDINDKLVERARKGDQQAMYRLYRMYVQAMYNTCIRIVINQYDAEDILQESFVSAFKNLDSFKGESSFGVWLKRIVINKSLNSLREKRQSFTDLDNLHISYEEDVEEDFPEVTAEIVHEAIKSLPEKARVVLNLYLLEGYMHKEIAQMLDISESTSKSQYQRARKLLQEKIRGEMNLKLIQEY
jgi:RNA polymerase sigma factor (sigma-70 family)